MNKDIHYVYNQPEKQNKMNKPSSIDVSFMCISLKSIGEQLSSDDFTDLLVCVSEAKDKGRLNEFLDQAYQMVEEGTDLVSSFQYAHYDIVLEPQDK